MHHCPFCILETEKSRILAVGKHAQVILSNPRLMPGHTLVIPKRHIEHPEDLTETELLEIFKFINQIRNTMLNTIATGVDIRQNYRPFLPQGRVKVDHMHFHVLPRTNQDELYQISMRFEGELFVDLSNEERDRLVDILGHS